MISNFLRGVFSVVTKIRKLPKVILTSKFCLCKALKATKFLRGNYPPRAQLPMFSLCNICKTLDGKMIVPMWNRTTDATPTKMFGM